MNRIATFIKTFSILSLLLTTGYISKAQYCTSGLYYYGCNYGDYIRSFSTTGGTTNISALNTNCNGGYSGYSYNSSQILSAAPGTTINFTVVNNPSWPEYYKIWVDFNRNGSFTDAGEQVFSQSISGNGTAANSFTIPSSAVSGATRIRVRCVYGGSSSMTPCGFYYGGETEDYVVNIAASAANNAAVTSVVSPGTQFCSGNYNVQVVVQNKGINKINNVQVNWILDGVAQTPVSYTTPIDVQGSSAGNSATITLGNVSYTNVPHTIKAFTSMPNNVPDTVNSDDTLLFTRRASPLALITTTGQTVYCGGGAVNTVLNATTGTGYSYQWRYNNSNIPGATTTTYTATAAGDYTLRVDSAGCFNISPILRIDNLAMPQPSISPEAYAVFCYGDSITLNANAGISGATYQWQLQGMNIPGATNASYVAKMPGNYTVKTTKFSCTVTSPGTNVSQVASPNPTITKNNNVLSTAGNFVSYQWYLNGNPLPADTFSICIAKQPGTYTVRVSNGGCMTTSPGTDVTAEEVNVVDINKANSIKIYPNPVISVCHVSAPLNTKAVITSADGRKLLESDLKTDIDMSNFTSGIYIIKISDNDGNLLKIEKIIKK